MIISTGGIVVASIIGGTILIASTTLRLFYCYTHNGACDPACYKKQEEPDPEAPPPYDNKPPPAYTPQRDAQAAQDLAKVNTNVTVEIETPAMTNVMKG